MNPLNVYPSFTSLAHLRAMATFVEYSPYKHQDALPWADHVDTSRQYIDTTVTSRNYPDLSNQIIQPEQHPFHYGGFANIYKGEYMGHTVSMNLIISLVFCLLLRFAMLGGY